MKKIKGMSQVGDAARGLLEKLSMREKVGMVAALAVVILIVLFSLVELIRPAFTAQTQIISSLKSDTQNLSELLDRFRRLNARKAALEARFHGQDDSGDVRSYLEDLIKEKTGISDRYSINLMNPREFGGEFEQTSLTVQFNTSDFAKVPQFLESVVKGSRPLLLTRLDMRKQPNTLAVTVELSSISRKG